MVGSKKTSWEKRLKNYKPELYLEWHCWIMTIIWQLLRIIFYLNNLGLKKCIILNQLIICTFKWF